MVIPRPQEKRWKYKTVCETIAILLNFAQERTFYGEEDYVALIFVYSKHQRPLNKIRLRLMVFIIEWGKEGREMVLVEKEQRKGGKEE